MVDMRYLLAGALSKRVLEDDEVAVAEDHAAASKGCMSPWFAV